MPVDSDPRRLHGKVVLVTGAARGLGRACAVAFARAGAHLVLVDVATDIPGVPYPLGTVSQLDHTAALSAAEGALTLAIVADVRVANEVAAAIDTGIRRFGRLDVAVNSAGIAAPAGKLIHEIDEADWQLMIDIDLSGCWRVIKAVAPVMIARRSGSIVNIASTAGIVGYRHFGGYVAAKHGVIGLSRAAALDLAPYKVRVNALCPGSVRDADWTEGRMLSAIAGVLGLPARGYEETFLPSQPLNALVEPEDVAAAALWLASDESRQVTGSVVAVDGGYSAR